MGVSGVGVGGSGRWNCSGEGGSVIVFLMADPNEQGSLSENHHDPVTGVPKLGSTALRDH